MVEQHNGMSCQETGLSEKCMKAQQIETDKTDKSRLT